MRRVLLLAAALLAPSGRPAAQEADPPAGVLSRCRNDVQRRRPGEGDWTPARDKMEVRAGDSLRTLEFSGVRLLLAGRGILQLDPNSKAVIRPPAKDADLELEGGGVFASGARVAAAGVSVKPKTANAGFSVRLGPDRAALVEVATGAATVSAQGASVSVDAGMAVWVGFSQPPSPPTAIANPAEFRARTGEFQGDYREVRRRAGLAPEPAAAARTPGPPAVPKDDLDPVNIGVAVSGYRVQLSTDAGFGRVVFDRRYDSETRLKASDVALPSGRYWMRVALVDLLGVAGAFGAPRPYVVGEAGASGFGGAKAALALNAPALDGEVVSARSYRVYGSLRRGVGVEVNGVPASLDAQGMFSTTVSLNIGENTIRVSGVDVDGRSAAVARKIICRP